MMYSLGLHFIKKKLLKVASIAVAILATQTAFSAPGDKVHAYFADEHNTTLASSVGNRILEVDIDNMTLVNSLAVPGRTGHHVDNGFNSKIYGVPKESGYINAIDFRKDVNGKTYMLAPRKIRLNHKPRSGDAFNKKFNVILMAASNRPMGSLIDVETDEVVGTMGEDIDCTLTDGSMLLSHSDANDIASATKYHCANEDHGGNQISGHPYWLTSDYAAIVDRTNRQISVYFVSRDPASNKLNTRLVNHLKTRTSIHQIIPRDRTSLPAVQQADFYATEEGKPIRFLVNGRGSSDEDYLDGIAHSLLHLRLTTNGLELIRRMDLQRTTPLSKEKSDRIIDSCIANYRNTDNYRNGRTRSQAYIDLFQSENIALSPDQDADADFPVECFFPGIPGGHNADFAPNNKHVYVPMAGGAMSVIDVDRWKIVNNLDIGIASGPGHTCFSPKHDLALTTNHAQTYTRVIRNINSDRPTISQYLPLGFPRAGLINTYQSHTCYIDEEEEYYYNFWTDGGVFYKMNLAEIAANTINGRTGMVSDSLVTGGIPIQGSYIYLKNIKDLTQTVTFAAVNDNATSDGNAVTIDVMQNDTGSSLELEHAEGSNYGTVAMSNGKVTYTPYVGFSGTDGFWYGISSPGLTWKWAYVTVTVKSSIPPTPLVANDDSAQTTPGSSVTIDVLANDVGTGHVLAVVDTAWIGTVTRSGSKIVYKAEPNFVGTADIWYAITDPLGNESWARAIVTIEKD